VTLAPPPVNRVFGWDQREVARLLLELGVAVEVHGLVPEVAVERELVVEVGMEDGSPVRLPGTV
jgi:hypothetical protein